MYFSHFLYNINISNYLQAIITTHSSMDKKIIWQLSSVILLFVPLEVLLQVNLPFYYCSEKNHWHVYIYKKELSKLPILSY